MKRTIGIILVLFNLVLAQVYNVGDVVADFSGPICANDTGDLHLYDYNGDENGGNYYVIWINLFTSW